MKLHKSKDPCFVCKTTENTAMVRTKTFSLTLCRDHAWEHLPEAPPKKVSKKKGKDLPGQKKLVET